MIWFFGSLISLLCAAICYRWVLIDWRLSRHDGPSARLFRRMCNNTLAAMLGVGMGFVCLFQAFGVKL